MTAVLKATALKNRVIAASPDASDYVFALKNQNAGTSNGCSGFITNTATGKHVYVSTDVGDYARKNLDSVMVRTAESTRDFTGGRNRWHSNDDFTDAIIDLLN